MSFIVFNKRPGKESVISTRNEAKSVNLTQEISQSFLLRNDNLNNAVISTSGRNPSIETDLSSSHFKIRFEKSPLSKGVAKPGDLSLNIIILILSILPFFGFSQNVKRIISLAPSITENLYLIGAQNKLVGCTSFCTQAIADGKEQIGSTVDVNIEKILKLKPDLVLAMLLTKPQDIESMRKLGIKVEVLPTPKNFAEICDQTMQIARLTGNEKSAEMAVKQARQQVDSLRKVMIGKPKMKIFFQLGANPVFTVLPNIFLNDFLLYSNSENIANGMKTGIITRESVLSKNPDVIFIATMGGFGESEKKVWESYKGLKAAETKKVFLIPSETSCSPTPDNFAKAFTDVVKYLNQ